MEALTPRDVRLVVDVAAGPLRMLVVCCWCVNWVVAGIESLARLSSWDRRFVDDDAEPPWASTWKWRIFNALGDSRQLYKSLWRRIDNFCDGNCPEIHESRTNHIEEILTISVVEIAQRIRWVVEPQLEVSKNRISLVQSSWASSYSLHGFPDFQRRTPDKYARIKMKGYDLLAGFKFWE